MKSLFILIGLILAVLVPINADKVAKKESFTEKLKHGVNGGNNCVICTALVGITEQLAIVYNTTVDESLEKLCNFLPDGIFRLSCKEAIIEFGPTIISGLDRI